MSANHSTPARAAAITAPVSRHLAVADAARSLAFYRDVLGFKARSVERNSAVPVVGEVVYGPARIQFVAGDGTAGNGAERRSLFFETDDVAAMHAASARAVATRPSWRRSTGSRCGCSRSATRTGTRCGLGNQITFGQPFE
jgi:catechol 2,3-dioxygenase-like lactoylglutathione lyase family enzyme